ncbi:NAD(P)H-dependent oxidoreductase [Stieleria sp. JC731]|uniref:FMN-dependent NADH-azoreductase n=1 Tax=Pirellulaceae TaxID=2691357 RepID=UPI001E5B54B1|nr:NAD(P)H-dependent oxidoreductase [Stieleria sp. JC731]MCC9599078.1 NAD(P)H-dependent oxidoreductase [Stieleria sp. JC731]
MAKLLYIESSPRKKRSKSIAVASAFLEAYQEQNPGDEVVKIDLWDKPLPEFDGDMLDAKYQVMHGQDFTEQQQQAWQTVVELCEEFKSADKYLIGLPMWNFGVPYKLKHYVDLIAQPGQTFSFDPATGYTGLVTGKPVAVVYSRGGAYGNDQAKAMDLQKGYMDLFLGFVGFTDISSVLVEPTLGTPEDVAAVEASAVANAKSIAMQF